MVRNISLILVLLIFLGLSACQNQKTKASHQPLKTITATMQSIPTQLFYGGTVSPIQYFNVTSPVEGIIKKINFKYGDRIQANDILFVITSSKLQQDFHSALTDFIKAKTAYTNAQINFRGTLELKKANIISDQEFLSDQDQYQDATLSYFTAKNALEKIVAKIPQINTQQLEQLSESDFGKIESFLTTQSSDLMIKASEAGVVLAPKSSGTDGGDGDSSGGSKTLQVGSQVKEDQTLVTIGDMSGIETTVPAGENVINNIKAGQAVTVTLPAIPNLTLTGRVKSVGAQAQTGGGAEQSGVANFPITVDVPKLTPTQSNLIRVGMSTKVTITIQNPPSIVIPITAVNQEGGNTTVTILNAAGQPTVVPVVAGRTTLDQVAITQGLKPGDRVVVP